MHTCHEESNLVAYRFDIGTKGLLACFDLVMIWHLSRSEN
jgi:hypothetical protein